MVPSNDLIHEHFEQTGLVGDGVLADVDVVLLKGLLDDRRNVPSIDFRVDEKEFGVRAE